MQRLAEKSNDALHLHSTRAEKSNDVFQTGDFLRAVDRKGKPRILWTVPGIVADGHIQHGQMATLVATQKKRPNVLSERLSTAALRFLLRGKRVATG